jgi:1-acyl-sn-glycerol-3-phosphate acyltransferase
MNQRLTLSIIIRSILFWILSAAVLPGYCLIALCIIPLNPRLRHRIVISAAKYFTFLLKHLGQIKYTVSGLENIPNTPAIFVGNHQSAWETAALNSILPPSVWIMKKELLNIPFFGWGIRALSAIAIDRSRGEDALAQVISQGKQRFAWGFSIIMFPEGTRVKPRARKPFKYGSAKLALSLGVPLVPFAHNAGYAMPKNSFWLYPGTVSVVIGAPIHPQSDDPVSYTQQIETWVYAQLDTIGG